MGGEMTSEERLAQTFRKIHACRAAFPYRQLAVAAACAGLGLSGTEAIGISEGSLPQPWWPFVVASVGARWLGGQLASWLVAGGGCLAATYIPAADDRVIVARMIIMLCVAAAGSLPARPSTPFWPPPLPVKLRSDHLDRIGDGDRIV
jgi:hypothetical protein